MPHTTRTVIQHPGTDVCAPRARKCALFNTAHLQLHSPRAQKGLDNLKGIRLQLRVLIMNTMLKMGTGSVTVHPEGLPSSTSARTKGSVRQRMKRHILSGPREVTVGGQAMPLMDVQPRTSSYHLIGRVAIYHDIVNWRIVMTHQRSCRALPRNSQPCGPPHGWCHLREKGPSSNDS